MITYLIIIFKRHPVFCQFYKSSSYYFVYAYYYIKQYTTANLFHLAPIYYAKDYIQMSILL